MGQWVNTQFCYQLGREDVKMMAEGLAISQKKGLEPTPLRRGMEVFGNDGEKVGYLAAVMVRMIGEEVLCLIIGHLPEKPGYQAIPLDWVEHVLDEEIFLSVESDVVNCLDYWHAV